MNLQQSVQQQLHFHHGYESANLQVGEQFTINQLLDVLLIPSANDAANVLAEKISGSISEFAKIMNEKALSLGCKNTHFVNPSGIHDENHYSTAYDLSLIGNYAMKNSIFREIVSKTSCSLPITDKYQDERNFTTTNKLLLQGQYYYPYAIGIKTGFTTPAGNCLVSMSLKDDIEYICVVLGSIQTEDGFSQRYSDTINLLNYANSNYFNSVIKKENELVTEIILPNTKIPLKLLAQQDVSALIPINLSIEFSPIIEIDENLTLPIYNGKVIGTATYTIDNTEYKVNLIAGNNVSFNDTSTLIFKVVMLIILLILIYFLIFPPKKNIYENRIYKIDQL